MHSLVACSVIALLGCGSAPVAPKSVPAAKAVEPQQEFWSPKKPKEPPLVRLALPRRYFILATEAGVTKCRSWDVEQSKSIDDDMAFLVDYDERIGFVNHGNELELRSRSRETRTGAATTTPCHGTFRVTALDDGLDVDG